MSPANQPWYQIMNVEEIPSPALLLFPDRVQSNIQGMLDMVDGDTKRLCPHVKTIKTEAIIRMMVRSGIKQFKCATIAEGETAIKAGAASVLLAIQPTTCNAKRWINLAKAHPDRDFGTIVDCKESIDAKRKHESRLIVWTHLLTEIVKNAQYCVPWQKNTDTPKEKDVMNAVASILWNFAVNTDPPF